MAQLIPITAIDDVRLTPYRTIRDRDLRGEHGARFIAEGLVVVRQLLATSRFKAESLLLSEAKASRLTTLLESAPEALPAYVAPQGILDSIVGFPVHRGVLAVGLRRDDEPIDAVLEDLPPRALVLGLIGLANHDNVGGIFRNAAAFGVDAVLLDGSSCDPLYRKALRVAVGASLHLPFHRGGEAGEMIERLLAAGFVLYALSPRGTQNLAELRRAPRTALLLGAEGPGLPPEILACAQNVRIPMRDGFDSLNVATASGIALYALTQT